MFEQYLPPIKTYTDAHKQRLAYVDTEKGEQVLFFIHGMGCTHTIWLELISLLSAKFRCIAIDLPKHGDSSSNENKFRLSSTCEQILGFIQSLHIPSEKLSICGHSMGGQIAMLFAIRYPSVFENLVLISSAGFENFKERELQLIKMGAQLYPSDLMKESTLAMLNEPVYEYLNTITKPSLLVYGTHDPMIPNPIAKNRNTSHLASFANKSLLNSKLIMLNYKAHFLPLEAKNELANAIFSFILK
jgi:pimeloyl-ACP methyl ester carboxylesterase